MAHVTVEAPDLALNEPMLVDGLPGKGLIGKLIADYLVTELEMEYYAGVYCEGVPSVAAYRPAGPHVRPPIQVYASEEWNLLALVSDIPISTANAPEFATCITDWLRNDAVTPIYISGLPEKMEGDDTDTPGKLYGLSTGDGDTLLDKADLVPPNHAGIVTGPTGALLNEAANMDLDSVGLLIESSDALPNYEAAQSVIDHGVKPITELEIDTDPFNEQSIEMSPVAESALEQLGESPDGSTSAQPTATFY